MSQMIQPIWIQEDGTPVSCIEKLKVLNENLAEFQSFFQDILDDAVAMGCSPQNVKQVFQKIILHTDTVL